MPINAPSSAFTRPTFTAPLQVAPAVSRGSSTLGGAAGGAATGFLAGGPVGAAIGAGASVVGSLLSNKGNNRATKAQTQSNDNALTFQREESAKEEARYKQSKLEQIAAWNDYNRTEEPRRKLRARLLGHAYVAPATVPPEGWTAPVQASSMTLGQLAGGNRESMVPQVMDPSQTLGSMAGYGGPQGARGPWGMRV